MGFGRIIEHNLFHPVDDPASHILCLLTSTTAISLTATNWRLLLYQGSCVLYFIKWEMERIAVHVEGKSELSPPSQMRGGNGNIKQAYEKHMDLVYVFYFFRFFFWSLH